MKKLLLSAIAIAVLAVAPLANATPMCVGGDQVMTGTVCSVGGFTFDFTTVSIVGSSDTLFFNASTGVAGNTTTLGFQVFGGLAADIDLNYSITGPAGKYAIDNAFLGPTTTGDSISEVTCTTNPSGGCSGTALATLFNTTGEITDLSGVFTSTGTFWINKDVSDSPYDFSEFTDTIESSKTPVPEPSSLVLLGSGLAGAAFLFFRRSRSAQSGSIA